MQRNIKNRFVCNVQDSSKCDKAQNEYVIVYTYTKYQKSENGLIFRK